MFDNNFFFIIKYVVYIRGRKLIIVIFLMFVIIEIWYKCYWNKIRREFIDFYIKKIKFSKKILLMVIYICICIIVVCVEKINLYLSFNDFYIRIKEEELNIIF